MPVRSVPKERPRITVGARRIEHGVARSWRKWQGHRSRVSSVAAFSDIPQSGWRGSPIFHSVPSRIVVFGPDSRIATLFREVHDALPRFAKPFNPQLDYIARFEILRRLHSQPNPGGCAGADHAPGSKVMKSLTSALLPFTH